jgi:DNA-binding transcriptional regulator LsrR (DeoR family)
MSTELSCALSLYVAERITEAMRTAHLLRQAVILKVKRWRHIEKLTQHEAARRLGIGRTVIAQDFALTKLETLLDIWDKVGGTIIFELHAPPEPPTP